jgi:DNA-binding NarL/FixJ family response regulator
MKKITVLLADHHPIMRRGLRVELEQDAQLAVIAEARSVTEAVEKAVWLRPRVAIIDMQLPDKSGVEACRQMVKRCPGTAVLILSAFNWDACLAKAWEAGAAGFVVKEVDPNELIRAIRQAAQGERVYTREQWRRIHLWQEVVGHQLEALTEREWEVLRLVVAGQRNREIADTLVLSENTVKKYIAMLLQKLGRGSRQGLIAFTVQHHLEV